MSTGGFEQAEWSPCTFTTPIYPPRSTWRDALTIACMILTFFSLLQGGWERCAHNLDSNVHGFPASVWTLGESSKSQPSSDNIFLGTLSVHSWKKSLSAFKWHAAWSCRERARSWVTVLRPWKDASHVVKSQGMSAGWGIWSVNCFVLDFWVFAKNIRVTEGCRISLKSLNFHFQHQSKMSRSILIILPTNSLAPTKIHARSTYRKYLTRCTALQADGWPWHPRECIEQMGGMNAEGFPSLTYRVTILVVPNLPLKSKQNFCFSMRPMY